MEHNTTSKEVEELIKPRYKVIAAYPHADFDIGVILEEVKLGATINPFYEKGKFRDAGAQSIYYPEEYPAIFKKLDWYEERKIEEMPAFIKYNNVIYKVKEYTEVSVKGFPENGHGIDVSLDCTLPATEQEYLTYQQSKK